MIAQSLSKRRIAITGSTGFVGTALVERLLRGVPDCELILLVRDGRRTPAARRTAREILANDAFDRLREEHATSDESFDDMCARRITTIAWSAHRREGCERSWRIAVDLWLANLQGQCADRR